MGKIIAIANQKGGVGKTTTSINLAAGMAYLHKKVLLIDLDPQGNATQGSGTSREQIEYSTYDLLLSDKSVDDIKLQLKLPPMHIIPSTIELAGADLEISQIPENREQQLKKKLEEVKEDYDYIIIDCPPSLGLLNTNALSAADSVIIPVQCEYYALEGLTQLLNTIRIVQRRLNRNLAIEGVLLTMLDRRTRLGLDVINEVKLYFKEKVFNTIIPRLVRLSEAPSFGKSIIAYDAKSSAAQFYVDLAKEVVKNNVDK